MSEEQSNSNRQRKNGDLSVFINNGRQPGDKKPTLWGKLVIDPKSLMEELQKNPTEDGMVELRVSLWGATAKTGAQYWYGNAKVNDFVRQTNENLPPGGEDAAAPALDPLSAPLTAPPTGDLPF